MEQARPDPGDPGVSRVVCELRDAGVSTQAAAVRELATRHGAGLTPAQTAAVCAAFGRPKLAGPDLDEACLPDRYWEDY